jgi:hypothetical protein
VQPSGESRIQSPIYNLALSRSCVTGLRVNFGQLLAPFYGELRENCMTNNYVYRREHKHVLPKSPRKKV